ncbi:Segment polarity protein dishevelled [Strongyloides ratti]|uniref:Segment polarity protein dishevelled n=1 Tax=Strongyloides ratti TaxID=34506 RepID=A0A090KQY3_STRRB|nr:Segment polarity protein dishevelled [Strongyloides ratti]CEF59779.1 Segment polarity protein dishevelled [Strongyloides ratti]
MNEEINVPKRKIKQYNVRSKTMDFIDTFLSPLRHNNVKEITNTISGSTKGKTLAIQSPSNTSTQNCLVIREKDSKQLKKSSTVIFEQSYSNSSKNKSPYDEINIDSTKNSIILKMRSSLKNKKNKQQHFNNCNTSMEDYSDNNLDSKPELYVKNIENCENKKNSDKSSLSAKINIFKMFLNSSKKKDNIDVKKIRKTKSYNCRGNTLNYDNDLSNRTSVCLGKEGNNNDEKKNYNNVNNIVDSYTVPKLNSNNLSFLNDKKKLTKNDSTLKNKILPQINVNDNFSLEDETNMVRVKLRQPKKYYGSHTTSRFIDCYNENVPDAPPRRKMIGFLHRTSNFSIDGTHSDDSTNHYSLENKNNTLLENNSKEKYNRLSTALECVTTSVPIKQKYNNRDRSLRYHKNINVILKLKTNEFLGINLVGHSSKNGDKGIFIADILPGGAISQCGRICVGDEILEMNGTSFENISNDQAVIMLTNELKKRDLLRLKIRKHYNSIDDYYDNDINNISIKNRFDSARRSLRDYPNHFNFLQPANDEIWIKQKPIKKNDNKLQLELPQKLMPSIHESYENLPSSPSLIKKSSKNDDEKKELTMHHVDKLFDLNSNKENVVMSMSLPNSYLEAKEKAWIKISYPMCFYGKHLVDWLLANVKGLKERRNARNYAFELLKEKLIVHVICRYTFSEQCYYVFGEKIEKLKKADECGVNGLII